MSGQAPYEKAIEETAKTTGKAIDATTELGKFTSRVFGATIRELASWLHDVTTAKHIRWLANNIDSVMENVEKLKQAGAIIRPLPARQAGLLLEAIAREDDEELQRLWAKLLDAATDAKSGYEVKRVHINVLQSIDPPEAKILDVIKTYLQNNPSSKQIDGAILARDVGVSYTDLVIYLHHLSTLGCFIVTTQDYMGLEGAAEPSVEIRTSAGTFEATDVLTSLFELL
jgi:hypothetical protein